MAMLPVGAITAKPAQVGSFLSVSGHATGRDSTCAPLVLWAAVRPWHAEAISPPVARSCRENERNQPYSEEQWYFWTRKGAFLGGHVAFALGHLPSAEGILYKATQIYRML